MSTEMGWLIGCYIDDCREPATYFVHSYPDDVRLCGPHSSLHPVEIGETECTGDDCRVCAADISEVRGG